MATAPVQQPVYQAPAPVQQPVYQAPPAPVAPPPESTLPPETFLAPPSALRGGPGMAQLPPTPVPTPVAPEFLAPPVAQPTPKTQEQINAEVGEWRRSMGLLDLPPEPDPNQYTTDLQPIAYLDSPLGSSTNQWRQNAAGGWESYNPQAFQTPPAPVQQPVQPVAPQEPPNVWDTFQMPTGFRYAGGDDMAAGTAVYNPVLNGYLAPLNTAGPIAP